MQRPMQCSVLAISKFSKAFDIHSIYIRLPILILDTGISSTFICWLQSFSNNRRTRVQLFYVFISSHHFTQGLPQGSLLAPLLFLFYINTLASWLNDDAVIALFADEVSILSTARKKEDAEAGSQQLTPY